MNYPARLPDLTLHVPQSKIVALSPCHSAISRQIAVGAYAAPRSGSSDVLVEPLLSTPRTSRPLNPPGQHALKPHPPLAEKTLSSHVRDPFAAIREPDLRAMSMLDVHGAEARCDAAVANHRHPDDSIQPRPATSLTVNLETVR
ncbi:hypothetical protein FB107DRAFT_289764 [Schizophyllum commune]